MAILQPYSGHCKVAEWTHPRGIAPRRVDALHWPASAPASRLLRPDPSRRRLYTVNETQSDKSVVWEKTGQHGTWPSSLRIEVSALTLRAATAEQKHGDATAQHGAAEEARGALGIAELPNR